MKIDNEFTVGVPIDRAWEALTDLEGIAPCMPGAQLTGVDGDVYSGNVKIKVGPVISQYAGTAQLVEKDEAAHRAVIRARGKDSRGAGNATALIDAVLHEEGAGTVVTVATDLNVTGKIAQFGSGMIQEVSVKLLGQFVQNLEAELHVAPGAAAAPARTPTPAPAPGPVARPPETGTAAGTAAGTTRGHSAAARTARGRSASHGAGIVESAAPASASVPAGATPTAADRIEQQRQRQQHAPHDLHDQQGQQGQQEPQPLDLMTLAGSSMYKRFIPIIAAVLVAAALIVYFVAR
ncbi:SRPBCC family protein [Streptomyces sp. NPDC058405]|uniref:SRPBCC family protein n=1 Tax=Streptomyces sp. NPDC058405 TaxID=3346482 RepID=UPI0036511756